MECNKDEAIRAKEIAEKKFTAGEYAGAKRFALKAHNLYPSLEGLSHFLTTLDIYISAENKVNGEVDWYSILGVNPFADDEVIRKQYRKMALTLHPDKNKSLGAEGAFKLVSEAWSLLSDKAKRLAYNQKRSLNRVKQKTSDPNVSKQSAPSSSGYQKNINMQSNVRTTKCNTRSAPSVPAPHNIAETFWTICTRCRTYYEYLRIYLNLMLRCPNCNDAFLAVEKTPPNYFGSSWSPHQQQQSSSTRSNRVDLGKNSGGSQNSVLGDSSSAPSFDSTKSHRGPLSRMACFDSRTVSSASVATQAASVGRASDKLKRKRERDKSNAQC